MTHTQRFRRGIVAAAVCLASAGASAEALDYINVGRYWVSIEGLGMIEQNVHMMRPNLYGEGNVCFYGEPDDEDSEAGYAPCGRLYEDDGIYTEVVWCSQDGWCVEMETYDDIEHGDEWYPEDDDMEGMP